jgi:hypothetical protein
MSVELEGLHEFMAGVESERAAEAMTLSRSVIEIYDALVDLGVFPIWDIPEHLKSARDVSFWSICGKNMTLVPVPRSKT